MTIVQRLEKTKKQAQESNGRMADRVSQFQRSIKNIGLSEKPEYGIPQQDTIGKELYRELQNKVIR